VEIKGGKENGRKEESWRDTKVVIYYICEEERESTIYFDYCFIC
jgi:hypothetical protein